MQKFAINSIEFSRCGQTSENVLNSLVPCEICNKLPIPPYRIKDSTHCIDCKFAKYKRKTITQPSKLEMNILRQVIISCKNESCKETFNINTLDEMIIHEETCGKVMVNLNDNHLSICKRCNQNYSIYKPHDCLSYLLNFFNKYKQETENLKKKFEDGFSTTIKPNINNILGIENEFPQKFENSRANLLEEDLKSIRKNNLELQLQINSLKEIIESLIKKDNLEIDKKITTLEQKIDNIEKSHLKKDEIKDNLEINSKITSLEKRIDNFEKRELKKNNKSLIYKVKSFIDSNLNKQEFKNKEILEKIDKLEDIYLNKIMPNLQTLEKANIQPIKSHTFDFKQYQMAFRLKGQCSSVNSLLELKDGKLASGLDDKTIKIWDLEKNECFKTIKTKHEQGIYCLIQLNNNNVVSSSLDGSIDIWDSSNFSHLLQLKEHKGPIRQVIELRNNCLASGSNDQSIKIWDLKSNKSIETINTNILVFTLVQLNDGKIAFSGGKNKDYSIKILEEHTYKLIESISSGHSDSVNHLIELSDGRLASGSNDKTIRIWDLKNNNCIISLNHSDFVQKIIQTKKNFIISCSKDNTVKIWDININKCVQTLNEHTSYVYSIIELKDGRIASGSWDKSIRIYVN